MILAKGKTTTDIWYEFMKFERDFGETKNVGLLTTRALNTLDKHLISNFLSDKTLVLLD